MDPYILVFAISRSPGKPTSHPKTRPKTLPVIIKPNESIWQPKKTKKQQIDL
jgi:hypothetical protein